MTVRKEKNGTYTADCSNGFDPVTGQQRRIVKRGFATRKEAVEAEQYIRAIDFKEKRFGGKVTIDILFSLMIEEDRRNGRKLSYINTQRNNFNKHIQNYFKNVNLAKLGYEDVFKFREVLMNTRKFEEKEEVLSPNTVNKIMILLKKILDVGLRRSLFIENPVSHLRKLPVEKQKMKFWTVREFREFINSIKEDESCYKILFTLLFFTGMRMGEALALDWRDIDLERKEINVHKTAYTVGGVTTFNSPKTSAGKRRISINDGLCIELRAWKAKQHDLMKEFTDNTNELQVVQDSPIQLNKDSVEKAWQRLLDRVPNVIRIRIHDLRHSHASLLIDQGADYLVVKERLGHASITTTIDTYSHLYPTKQEILAKKLDDFF